MTSVISSCWSMTSCSSASSPSCFSLPSRKDPDTVDQVVGVEDEFGVVGALAQDLRGSGLERRGRSALEEEVGGVHVQTDSDGADASLLEFLGQGLGALVPSFVRIHREQNLFNPLQLALAGGSLDAEGWQERPSWPALAAGQRSPTLRHKSA